MKCDKVKELDKYINGNGQKGLMTRVASIETYQKINMAGIGGALALLLTILLKG